jgi:hypothetical protein
MNPNWAEENLQTIRTLMERSALYRRALAPIMLYAGALGMASAVVGLLLHLDSTRLFDALWLGTAVVAVAGAFFIARRQAIKDKENLWSPPTRRVAQALAPPLTVGMFFSLMPIVLGEADLGSLGDFDFGATLAWILFYGCALHSAGFFMPRGIKFFGLIFIASASGLFFALCANWLPDKINAHWFMGFFFGVLHLAYGAYLYLTEKKNPVA